MAVSDASDFVGLQGDPTDKQAEGDPGAKPEVAIAPIEGRGDWQTEIVQQLRLAAPICGMNLLNYLVNLSAVIFVGHLGKLELASVSIAVSIVNVTGNATLMGLSSGLETLCGQAYGARAYEQVGIFMQRGFLLLTLCSLPIAALWLYMEPLLRLMGQEQEIATMAAQFAFCLLPTLFAGAWVYPMQKFMQAQSIATPMALMALLSLTITVPANYLFIHVLGIGFRGAALASSLASLCNLIGLGAYIRFSGRFEKTFRGWSWEATRVDFLVDFLKLAAPSWSMMCLEWWCFEAVILSAGILEDPELQVSALSICLNTAALFYMVPFGLSAAASTRVANEVGAGWAEKAKKAAQVALTLACIQGTLSSLFVLFARGWWPWLFTSNSQVKELVTKLLLIEVWLLFFDCINGVLSGVIRGVGRQAIGTLANLGSFYLVGIPMAILLAFVFNWQAVGLWTGISIGCTVQVVFLLAISLYTDFHHVVATSVARCGDMADVDSEPLLV